jgi:hypothetical protein
MKEDENIHEYHMSIMDIANSSKSFGVKMSEEKLVTKILRSLPKRFDMKVTTVEEANDISEMKVDELIGSLKTFEVAFNDKSESKLKNIAFASNTGEDELKDGDSAENVSESIALIGKQLNRVIQRLERKLGTNAATNAKANQFNNSRNNSTPRKNTEEDQGNQGRVQCHECEGFGHIRSECPTFIKRRGLTATWSDGDSDSEDEQVSAKIVRALTSVCEVETTQESLPGICEPEPTQEETTQEFTYEEISNFYTQACEENQELTRKIAAQQDTIKGLVETRDRLFARIFHMKEDIEELEASMEDLDIEVRVLRYKLESIKKEVNKEQSEVQASLEKLTLGPRQKSGHKLKHPTKYSRPRMLGRYDDKVCHFCGKEGHNKVFCYEYQKAMQNSGKGESSKQNWEAKDEASLIAHTSFRATSKEDWYFDSGCTNHGYPTAYRFCHF